MNSDPSSRKERRGSDGHETAEEGRENAFTESRKSLMDWLDAKRSTAGHRLKKKRSTGGRSAGQKGSLKKKKKFHEAGSSKPKTVENYVNRRLQEGFSQPNAEDTIDLICGKERLGKKRYYQHWDTEGSGDSPTRLRTS